MLVQHFCFFFLNGVLAQQFCMCKFSFIFYSFFHLLTIMTERYSEYIRTSNLRRKATATVKARLESIYTSVSIDEATDPAESQLPEQIAYCSDQVAECGDHVADYGGRADIGDLSEQDLETIMETECTAEAYPWTMGESGKRDERDDSDEEIEQPSLTTSLMNWAIEYGITLVALTALLSILRCHHPSLPKDAKTLLQTNRNYIIKQVAGGAFFYFGIAFNLHLKAKHCS